jgi:UDP:flavonoid glycosyltransferase YjiC (YdhE family)
VLNDSSYREAAATLQAAHARRDGVAEIGDLIDEVIAEHHVEARHA